MRMDNYMVEKSNLLVELKGANMTLQELRFFCVYLSKINARDVSTRCVRFSLSDFRDIMGLGKLNVNYLKKVTNNLLRKIVNLPNADGGYTGFPIFGGVRIFKDALEQWNVEIDASDYALPYLFDISSGYVSYRLYNVLSLKSAYQIRLYELLKKYEKIGVFEVSISDLRDYLSIGIDQYSRFENFKVRVLNDCKIALADNTDIFFDYECGRRGGRGKWLTIVFHIFNNNNNNNEKGKAKEPERKPEHKPVVTGSLRQDVSAPDIDVLCDMLSAKVSNNNKELLMKQLEIIYGQALIKSKEPIKNPVAYLSSCISNMSPDDIPSVSDKKNKKSNFNIDMYKQFVNDF